jgi:hypothetical protein
VTFPHWRSLHSGDERRCLLVFDFGPGRPGAGFDDLVPLLGRWPAMESVPPATLAGVSTWADGRARLRAMLREVVESGADVAAVLGYCAGSAPATSAAMVLGETTGTVPRVILFDPEHVEPATLHAAHAAALSALRLGAADQPPNGASETLAGLAAGLLSDYERTAGAALQRLRLPPKYATQLVDRFRSYLAYLLFCAACEQERSDVPADVLYSASPVPRPGGTHTFDVSREELLAHPDVVRVVSTLLAHDGRPG